MMQYYISISDSSGTIIGPGPIVSAEYWESTKAVDRIGDFTFAMPASDPKADLIAARRRAYCYAILPNGPTLVGAGIIDLIETQPGDNGGVTLVISGATIERELVWRTVEFLQLTDGTNPVTHVVAVANIGTKAPAGWTLTPDVVPPNDDIYYFFAGESVYAAALKVAALTRDHIWMPTPFTLRWQSVWADSGLYAIEAGVTPNLSALNQCIIGDLSIVEDTYDLISRIIAYGADQKDVPATLVTLFNSTKSVPTGYTINKSSWYGTWLRRDATEITYGRVELFQKFSDIEAASTSAGDQQSAANMLLDAALWELQRRSEPASFYKLSLIHAPGVIEPMQTIRCVFRRNIDGRNAVDVDESLYIMGATTRIDATGMRTTALDVATVDRWPEEDTNPIVQAVRNNLRIR